MTYDASGTSRLLDLVNAHRHANGLRPLVADARLATIAQGWTLSMATTQTLAHNDALFTSATHDALRVKVFGENVAYSSVSVDDAHDALMHSPHHLANIETAAFAVAGFAVARDARGWVWVTEDFGTPPRTVAAPVIRPVVRRVVRAAATPVVRSAARPRPARPRASARPVARTARPLPHERPTEATQRLDPTPVAHHRDRAADPLPLVALGLVVLTGVAYVVTARLVG